METHALTLDEHCLTEATKHGVNVRGGAIQHLQDWGLLSF